MSNAKHDMLKDNAKNAINALHGDTTVSQEQTLESLEEIREDLTVMIDTLKQELGD